MNENEYLVRCKETLDNGNFHLLVTLLQDKDNEDLIRLVGWELVSVICKAVANSDDTQTKTLEEPMNILLELCTAKEYLLGITECLSPSISTTPCKFDLIVTMTARALLKLQRNHGKHLEDICDQIISCVYNFFDGNMVTDDTEVKNTIESAKTTVLSFIKLINEKLERKKQSELDLYLEEKYTCTNGWNELAVRCCRKTMLKFIFHFLEFMVPDQKKNSFDKEDIKQFIITIFKVVTLPDLLDFLKSEKKISTFGVTVFLHYILTQQICYDELPLVYSLQSMYWFVAPYISFGLLRTDENSICLSLNLLQFTVGNLPNKVFIIDQDWIGYSLLKGLSNVMVFCGDKKLRGLAKIKFETVVSKYNDLVKFILLRKLYEDSEHPGLLGYLISLTNNALQAIHEVDPTDEIFANIRLLFDLYLQVVLGETNVLQESDRIMAALNLLRYWLLRDSKKMFEWYSRSSMERNLQLILNCVDVSKVELQKLVQSLDGETDDSDTIAIELIIPGGETMQDLPNAEKKKMMAHALCTLDMMASVIARTNEIIDDKCKSE